MENNSPRSASSTPSNDPTTPTTDKEQQLLQEEGCIFDVVYSFVSHVRKVEDDDLRLDLAAFLSVVKSQSAVPVADVAGSASPAASEDVMQNVVSLADSSVVAAGAGGSAAAVSSGATPINCGCSAGNSKEAQEARKPSSTRIVIGGGQNFQGLLNIPSQYFPGESLMHFSDVPPQRSLHRSQPLLLSSMISQYQQLLDQTFPVPREQCHSTKKFQVKTL
uniref:Uncharacterized protein n=1 Tax=Salix viminalis TaxID=40686 RepID=A0A6N2LVE3_SALVM